MSNDLNAIQEDEANFLIKNKEDNTVYYCCRRVIDGCIKYFALKMTTVDQNTPPVQFTSSVSSVIPQCDSEFFNQGFVRVLPEELMSLFTVMEMKLVPKFESQVPNEELMKILVSAKDVLECCRGLLDTPIERRRRGNDWLYQGTIPLLRAALKDLQKVIPDDNFDPVVNELFGLNK